MACAGPEGHRVGEVDEIIIDEEERRARLLVGHLRWASWDWARKGVSCPVGGRRRRK